MLVKYESKKSNNMSTIYGKVCFNSKIHVNFDFILFCYLRTSNRLSLGGDEEASYDSSDYGFRYFFEFEGK